MAVKFGQDDVLAGGAVFQEGYADITAAEFVIHQLENREGKKTDPALYAHLTLQPLNAKTLKPDGDPHEEFSSCGTSALPTPEKPGLVPSEDGLEPAGMKVGTSGPYLVGINHRGEVQKDWTIRGCKFTRLIASAQEAGLKGVVIDEGDIRGLVGVRAHFHTVVEKMTRRGSTEETSYNVLLIDKIVSQPDGGKGGKKKAAVTREEPEPDETDDELTPVQIAAISALKKVVKKAAAAEEAKVGVEKVKARLVQLLAGNPKQKQIVEAALDEDFLTAQAEEIGATAFKNGNLII